MIENNQTINSILSRRSVRQFTNKPVEKFKIDLILKSAMSAPSARNRQAWMFVVVDERGILDDMANELPYAKMLFESPLAIVVCGDIRDKNDLTAQAFWVQDCSAAVENILVATHALNLGAVWTACFPKEDRVDIARKILNIPDGIVPLCVIPIGYPKNETPVIDKWNEQKIVYNKFNN